MIEIPPSSSSIISFSKLDTFGGSSEINIDCLLSLLMKDKQDESPEKNNETPLFV